LELLLHIKGVILHYLVKCTFSKIALSKAQHFFDSHCITNGATVNFVITCKISTDHFHNFFSVILLPHAEMAADFVQFRVNRAFFEAIF